MKNEILLFVLFFVLFFLVVNSFKEIINKHTKYSFNLKIKAQLVISSILATNFWLVILGLLYLANL